jgi:gliding motility-associated-like protein/uncharacterized repeat protein (TIGR01451 family)
MKSKLLIIITAALLFLTTNVTFGQVAPNLGSTSSFALFTAAGAFNVTGAAVVKGDVGTNVGAFNAFPPGTLVPPSLIYLPSSAGAVSAATDVATAYAGLTQAGAVLPVVLDGITITPGVYATGAAASLGAGQTFTLNGLGNPNSIFIIRINGGALSLGVNAKIVLINSASPNNVYWQISGATTVAGGSVFNGNIISGGAITFLGDAKLFGRGLTTAGQIDVAANLITLGAPPIAPVITLSNPTCVVLTGTITVTSPTGLGMTYSIDGLNYTNTTGVFSGLAPGSSYNVTAKDIDGYVSSATSVTIGPIPMPPTATASNNGPVCEGTSLILTGGPNGMVIYAWTGPNGYTGNTQNPTVSLNATSLMAGTYTLTVTDINGCTDIATTNVVVNAAPVATASNNGPVCEGTSLSLIGGPIGMTSYSWTGPNLYTSNSQNPIVSANATTLMAGNYILTVTSASGCIGLPVTTSVIVNASPVATASNNGPVCAGTSLSLIGGPIGMTSYSWTGPNLYTSNSQNPIVSANATTLMAGNYILTVTSASGCIGLPVTTSVIVNALPVASAGSNSPVCTGNSINLTAQAVAGATYAWTGPAGYTSIVQNPVILSALVTNTGNYTLIVTANGCPSVPSVTAVVVNLCSSADLMVVNTVNDAIPLIGRNVTFTVVVTNNGPTIGTGITVSDLLESGYTYVSSTATAGTYVPSTGVWTIGSLNSGNSATMTITAKVKPSGSYSSTATVTGNEPDINLANNTSTTITFPADFFIPEGFSPDGDGINDLFIVRGIFFFPDNSIVIYNRWGNKVYEANPYKNTWDGRSIRGMRVGGDELPTGTYFYLLDLHDGTAIFKGTIYLNRK